MRYPVVLLFVSSLSLFLVGSSAADIVLYDSNGFESPTFTAGSSPVGQDDSNPWSGIGSPTAFTVETSKVASGVQAVQANGGGLNDGSFTFPGIFYAPDSDQRVLIQVDMARTLSADSSPVYAIDVYDDGVNRTSRFGLQDFGGTIQPFVSVPINDSGVIDPTGTGIKSQPYGAAVAADTFVHFDFWLDYSTQTVKMSIDGTTVAAGVPFVTQSSSDIVAAALQVGTFTDSADHGYFDNYSVSVVPYLHGDVNNDGVVNGLDISQVASNWLHTGVVPTGDANEDGVVNGLDIALIASNWLHALANPSTMAAAVPEPGSLALAILGGILVSGVSMKHRYWTT